MLPDRPSSTPAQERSSTARAQRWNAKFLWSAWDMVVAFAARRVKKRAGPAVRILLTLLWFLTFAAGAAPFGAPEASALLRENTVPHPRVVVVQDPRATFAFSPESEVAEEMLNR